LVPGCKGRGRDSDAVDRFASFTLRRESVLEYRPSAAFAEVPAVAEAEKFARESWKVSRGDVGTSGRGTEPMWDEATAVGWYCGESG